MGNTESTSSSHCGPTALGSFLLPRQSASLVVKVEDDPSEVTFQTWLEEDSATRAPIEGDDDHSPGSSTSRNHNSLVIPRKDDKDQSSLLLVTAQLAHATERIDHLERLRKIDQELVRTLNVKLKHLLQVQAEYLAFQKQCEAEEEEEEEKEQEAVQCRQ
uniref:Uncharacterized protein n=1 Tax=Amphora coffeiformis TaxID=265554 RepID=A0A7S3L622_9STRA|mmetsp:Transcript_7564/g.14333  ORF Transcript_7564/g.14333 Transcript_7564/m.14333 type:complete len:160 (+) Transcript_7564:125-604(+)|eukprot:scaffold1064_cov85-Amphora_coffeaeformis.AAC.15